MKEKVATFKVFVMLLGFQYWASLAVKLSLILLQNTICCGCPCDDEFVEPEPATEAQMQDEDYCEYRTRIVSFEFETYMI